MDSSVFRKGARAVAGAHCGTQWAVSEFLVAAPQDPALKRLRPHFLYDRALSGTSPASRRRTLTAFIRATTGERDLSVGVVASI